jgi:hypothetical protein
MGEQWISNDTMCRLCPKIKLADYQLIGVNWMALLHSMKCDLTQKNGDMVASGGNADSEDDDDEEYGKAPKKKNSRSGKKANVNGVLADEMVSYPFSSSPNPLFTCFISNSCTSKMTNLYSKTTLAVLF